MSTCIVVSVTSQIDQKIGSVDMMSSTKRLSAVGGYDAITSKLVAMQDADLEFAPTLVPKNGSFLLAAQSEEELAMPSEVGPVKTDSVGEETGKEEKDGVHIVPSIMDAFSETFPEVKNIPHDEVKTASPSSGLLTFIALRMMSGTNLIHIPPKPDSQNEGPSLDLLKPFLNSVDNISLSSQPVSETTSLPSFQNPKPTIKRRPASIMVPTSLSRNPSSDNSTNTPPAPSTSPSKKAHRLSFNGHEEDHIAAFATLGRSKESITSTTSPEALEPEEERVHMPEGLHVRQDSSGSLMDLYKYERAEDRKLVKRVHVMRELRDSERLYVADLRTLVESCFDRLNAASWLPSEKRFMLMRNANELYKFQQEFLTELEEALAKVSSVLESLAPVGQIETPIPVAEVFLKMREKFNVYKDYCTQHDGAIKILTEYEKRPEMISFLQEFRGTAHTKLDLKDYLIKPVQRLCRYPLLLQELIKNTEPDAADYVDLLSAYSVMQEVVVDIDSAKVPQKLVFLRTV
ncbi:Pleckstrin y domain-containing G member 1 [Rhizophlyctis rosea]|uniref:Pleckstrin y domain-containing G member 1 n=1 Tax=Rhizophlyctis rosea TaxID=64517 RepID=A0AAD5SH27_9FUNG|nr:Pleckstrin y domain-containing G member 1 [Rhizophlyctis rosea]